MDSGRTTPPFPGAKWPACGTSWFMHMTTSISTRSGMPRLWLCPSCCRSWSPSSSRWAERSRRSLTERMEILVANCDHRRDAPPPPLMLGTDGPYGTPCPAWGVGVGSMVEADAALPGQTFRMAHSLQPRFLTGNAAALSVT